MENISAKLRVYARERLPTARYLHTLGVEQAAVTLAMRWDEDVQYARWAALLHDITKAEENQLKLCRQYGIIPPEFERETPKLLHAVTAEAVAREWDMPPAVCSAIRWHTTGRAGMSTLEKIIYLADYIDPFRPDFFGLKTLRGLVYRDLNQAMAFGLELTITVQRKRGNRLHPASCEALSALRTHTTED